MNGYEHASAQEPAPPIPAVRTAPGEATEGRGSPLPIHTMLGTRAPRDLDRAEAQARTVAVRLAAGSAAGIPATAPHSSGSEAGTRLPERLRATFERSVGVDLSTIRIHADAAPAAAVKRARARAVTVGEDIAIAAGLYRPDDAAGRVLLAHEVAHVVQQRSAGVRPQYDDAAEEPVWMSVTLHGLWFTSPGRLMPKGEPAMPAYLRIVLHRLAPAATPQIIDEVIDAIGARRDVDFSGTIAPNRTIAADERFSPVNIGPGAAEDVEAMLRERGVALDLNDVQRRLLRLGIAADRWRGDAIAALRKEFPWYSEELWNAQLDMHAAVLDEAVTALGTRPGRVAQDGTGPAVGPISSTARRAGGNPARPPAGPAADHARHRRRTSCPAGRRHLVATVGSTPGRAACEPRHTANPRDPVYWTASDLYDPAVTDRAARFAFLLRLGNWIQRAVRTIDSGGDYTQELLRDPGRFTDQPFPAHLEAVPAPTGKLRVVPSNVERRYRFSVDFNNVFDAFGSYAYRWDVLAWPVAGGDTAGAIGEVESGRSDAARRRGARAPVRGLCWPRGCAGTWRTRPPMSKCCSALSVPPP